MSTTRITVRDYEITDLLTSSICSTGPTVDVKAINREIELGKQLEAADPIIKVFGPAAYLEPNRGQSAGTYVSKTNIGDVVAGNALFKACSAGQNMLHRSGESYER